MGICPSFPATTTFFHYEPPPAQISRSPSKYTLQNRIPYEAAWFILQSFPAIGFQALNVANTSPAEPTPEPGIKKDLGALFAEFSKTIIEAIKSNKAPNGSSTSNRAVECIMCGGPHYGRECSMVDEYIKAGKCKRNFEGKVVLLSGALSEEISPVDS
jgi:hypothetical protein